VDAQGRLSPVYNNSTRVRDTSFSHSGRLNARLNLQRATIQERKAVNCSFYDRDPSSDLLTLSRKLPQLL